MTILEQREEEILDTNTIYDDMVESWKFWGASYEGEEEFLKYALKRHERESEENYKLRLEEGEVYNYSSTIIDIFSFFLNQIVPHRELNSLSDNKQWNFFITDTDLHGTNYDIFWQNASKLASIYGVIGILVDKPVAKEVNKTVDDEIRNNIYPYFATYIPENILNWEWNKNSDTYKYELVYLKLKESETSIVLWTKTEWERWVLQEASKEGKKEEWILENTNTHSLNEIPFIWFTNNISIKNFYIGLSDIKGISRIQAAITRDISHGNEIIKYAAFPMLLKPMIRKKPTENEDTVGVTAILEFDPEFPHAKPQWLESKVLDPINAILKWLEQKVMETYRVAHLSSIHGKGTNKVKSGVALQYEFQQLSAALSLKGKTLDEAELLGIKYWLKWQEREVILSDINISRPTSFNIDDVSLQLENMLVASEIIVSDLFHKAMQKKIIRQVLPETDSTTIAKIDIEIDKEVNIANRVQKYRTKQSNTVPIKD